MEISSAPYLIDPIEFGLSDLAKNQSKLAFFKGTYTSKVVGSYNAISLIEYTKSSTESFSVMECEEEIVYLVHLKVTVLPHFPTPTVTQVEVWRKVGGGSSLSRGLPQYVFEHILMKRYKYVVSDQAQSERGRDFWIDVMDQMTRKQHDVGVFDVDESTIDWCPKGGYSFWIRNKEQESWGKEFKHEFIRFVIRSHHE